MIDLGGDVLGDGAGKMVFTMLSAVAVNERERIRDVKRHLAKQGVYGGGERPFGVDIILGATPNDPARLVANTTRL